MSLLSLASGSLSKSGGSGISSIVKPTNSLLFFPRYFRTAPPLRALQKFVTKQPFGLTTCSHSVRDLNLLFDPFWLVEKQKATEAIVD